MNDKWSGEILSHNRSALSHGIWNKNSRLALKSALALFILKLCSHLSPISEKCANVGV